MTSKLAFSMTVRAAAAALASYYYPWEAGSS
jgi:hypothetical protein